MYSLGSAAGGETIRTSIRLTTNAPLGFGSYSTAFESPLIAVSPSGNEIAYVAKTAESTQLYRRALDGWEARPVPNTVGAIHPFYSPDGQSLGFLTSDKVKKVTLLDGSVQELCNAQSPIRAFWRRDDSIYVVVDEGFQLARVSSKGGALETILPSMYWTTASDVLPNCQAALVTTSTNSIRGDFADISVVDLRTLQGKSLNIRGYDVRYVASGHLVFSRDGSIYAVPFDADRLVLSGSPIKVVPDVAMNSLFFQTQASVSENGTLIYVAGRVLTSGRIAWVDRQGKSGGNVPRTAGDHRSGGGEAPSRERRGSRRHCAHAEDRAGERLSAAGLTV